MLTPHQHNFAFPILSVYMCQRKYLHGAGKGKKKGDRDVTLTKNDNGVQQSLDIVSGEYKLPLVWIDLEMTGRYLFYIIKLGLCPLTSVCQRATTILSHIEYFFAQYAKNMPAE